MITVFNQQALYVGYSKEEKDRISRNILEDKSEQKMFWLIFCLPPNEFCLPKIKENRKWYSIYKFTKKGRKYGI